MNNSDFLKNITAEEAIEYVKNGNDFFLSLVPQESRTAELCLEAVKASGSALQFVPEKLKTAELCSLAVKDKYGGALKYVPEKLKTAALCFESVTRFGQTLKYVPEKYMTSEICHEAVKSCAWALEFVPEKYKTANLYIAAVRQNGKALRFVPQELRTEELCLEAVKQDYRALEYVDEKLKAKKEFADYDKRRKFTDDEREKIISAVIDLFGDDLNLPEEPTKYDVLMKQKTEEFIRYLLQDNEPEQIKSLVDLCDDDGFHTLGLAILYDMWLNKSAVWPVTHNPEWAEWEKLKEIKAGKSPS